MFRVIFLLVFLALSWNRLHAQSSQRAELESQWVTNASGTFCLLDPDIVKTSVFIILPNGNSMFIADSMWVNGACFKVVVDLPDSVEVFFRRIALDLLQPRQHKFIGLNADIKMAYANPFEVLPEAEMRPKLNLADNLEKQGSISRGLGIGNNQNLVLNAGFNLQLSGKLTDSIELLASMTDNNLPFQPDGYTQQIQDFDRVFVQLKNSKSKLTVGDYDLRRPTAHFLVFDRNVKGVQVEHASSALWSGKLEQTLSFSAARGQFGRNVFMGREGNQGPYRLTGNNQGNFIVVLAGSERVYLDGELLKRGEQYDYVIDYNTADVVFTPQRLITNQSRIIIEFEYANQAYARSIVNYGANYRANKLALRFNSYRESDNRNQPLFQELTEEQQFFLSQQPANQVDILFPSAQQLPFEPGQIRYRQIDSLGFSPVYEYSINPDSANYAVSFSFVGQGNGNYIIANSNANGRVFKWVQPTISNGDTMPQGTHEAVVQLVPPTKLQMHVLGVDYQVDDYSRVGVELAHSVNSSNLYSVDPAANKQGRAIWVKALTDRPVFPQKRWFFKAGVELEWLNEDFRMIQPNRNVEFARDWNVANLYALDQESRIVASAGMRLDKRFEVDLNQTQYLIASNYRGVKQGINILWTQKGYEFQWMANDLNIASANFTGAYGRMKGRLSKKIKQFEMGGTYELEHNLMFAPATDSLLNTSFRFDVASVYVKKENKWQDRVSVSLTSRLDQLPVQNQFLQNSQLGTNATLATELNRWEQQTFKVSVTYRILEIFESPMGAASREATYLGQLDYAGAFFNRMIQLNSFYAYAQGQELRREISYFEVPRGQGNYTWIDYNENGVQELDEFELAIFSDQANYVKLFLPGNNFISTYSTKFNQSIQIDPSRKFKNQAWLRKLSYLLIWSVDQKNQGDQVELFANPFYFNDTAVVSSTNSFRNTLFINKNNPRFGIDLGTQSSQQRLLLTNGIEARINNDRSIKLRWNILPSLTFENLIQQGNRQLVAAMFERRNFNISQFEWLPVLNWNLNEKWRFGFKYAYRTKSNAILNEVNNLPQQLEANELGLTLNYNLLTSSAISVSISRISNAFSGPLNNPTSFEMLQGLQPGQNQVWSISYFNNLASNLQLNFTYDGRSSESTPVIHVGRIQARLMF